MTTRVLRPRKPIQRPQSTPTIKHTGRKRAVEAQDPHQPAAATKATVPPAGPLSKEARPPKKAKYVHHPGGTPFPDHLHPTPEECREVERLLTLAHGPSVRPETNKVNNSVSGCGEVPSVLDALMRTILSANTSNANSTRAFQGLVKRYGLVPTATQVAKSEADDDSRTNGPASSIKEAASKEAGSVDWDAVRRAPLKDLYEAIKLGGLADMKSRNMKVILDEVWQEGKLRKNASPAGRELSLDHLHDWGNEEAMEKLTAFKGVGVKTASCVLLFCLRRDIFAVDTHVFRLSKFLGWIPENATRDTACFHLDTKVPPEMKYPLHNLLIRHGRICKHCKAGPERNSLPAAVKSPKIKIKKDPDVEPSDSPTSTKTKKIWVGNEGLMKEIAVKVDDHEDEAELGRDECVLEHLMTRVRVPRKTTKKSDDED